MRQSEKRVRARIFRPVSFSLIAAILFGVPVLRRSDESAAHAAKPAVKKPPERQPARTGGRGKVLALDDEKDIYRAYCDNFEKIASLKQEKDLWCWAACIEMLAKYRNARTKVTQEEIVGRVQETGATSDPNSDGSKGAIQWEVVRAVSPQSVERINKSLEKGKLKVNLGKAIAAIVDVLNFDDTDLVESISQGKPVLLSLRYKDDPAAAHMVVVHSVDYQVNPPAPKLPFDIKINGKKQSKPAKQYTVLSVAVTDPAKGDGPDGQAKDALRRVSFDEETRGRITYMMSEKSAEEFLKQLTSH